MRQSIRACWAALVIAAAAAAGCVSSQKIADTPASDLDKKLATFSYIEEGDLVTFIVSTRPARYRENDGYVPFEISVANNGLRDLVLSRESFELRDSAGNRYPAVGPAELIENYEFLDLDRQPTLAELDGLVFDRYAAYTRYPSNFSPTRAFGNQPAGRPGTALGERGVVRDRMSLPRYGYMVDYIYFPTPATGVKGQRFELFLNAPELPDPVFVKFEVK